MENLGRLLMLTLKCSFLLALLEDNTIVFITLNKFVRLHRHSCLNQDINYGGLGSARREKDEARLTFSHPRFTGFSLGILVFPS